MRDQKVANYGIDLESTLGSLYLKGKSGQWDSEMRIDWPTEIDRENPFGIKEDAIPLAGSDMWADMDHDRRTEVRRNVAAWQLSQFYEGERGALACAAKLVQQAPGEEARLYAATQVMDEARHVEVFGRYLALVDDAYPASSALAELLDIVIDEPRWDMTFLGMQVLIEGLALAAFSFIRNESTDPLARRVMAYVMQDEGRHVAFGRNALRQRYRELTSAELAEREQFCVHACFLMRDRFMVEQVWDRLGLPVDEAVRVTRESEFQTLFRSMLFMRIVPTLKDIGLWGPTIRDGFETMGVRDFEVLSLDSLHDEDESIAAEVDAWR